MLAVELGIAPQYLETADPDTITAMLAYMEEKARRAKAEELGARLRGG